RVDAYAQAHEFAQFALPTLIEALQDFEDSQGGGDCSHDLIFLRFRGAPHGHDFIADIVDDHAFLVEHALRQLRHHVAEPAHGGCRSQFFTKAAEVTNVAEESGDFELTPFQQVRLFLELTG